MIIEKQKLPKGFSYPLKTSMLEAALAENRITTETHLIYSISKMFFDAHYWLPNENVDHYRFYVRVGHVSSTERKKAQAYMKNKVIPNFIAWAKELTQLPISSTKLSGDLYYYKNYP